MEQLNVSICVRKNVLAVLLTRNGKLISRTVENIKDSTIVDSVYLSLLYGIKKSLLKVRNYLENNSDVESVVFELNNSTLVSWIKSCVAKEAYQDSFIEVMRLLQEIPMQYTFVVNAKPKALRFADKAYIVKDLKLTNFSFDDFEEG